MTVLDLIRKLHAEGKPVVAYDLFIYDNFSMSTEDAVSASDEDTTVRIADVYIPPQYLRIEDNPRYIYVEDSQTYKKLTRLKERIPINYPRLLLPLLYDWDVNFFTRYIGKHWKDIPPVEVEWAKTTDYVELLLDKNGVFCKAAYDVNEVDDSDVSFYPVRTPYGAEFSWMGDIIKDPLPDGLTLISD